MGYMFYQCTSLKSIDLSNFDTSSVTLLESTFRECESLISLDLSNFNTSNVRYMVYIFNGCSSLKYLDMSGLNLNQASLDFSFTNCNNLRYINLENITFTSRVRYGLSALNNINNLIVCQNSGLITSSNAKNICCDYNIEIDLCQSSNYIILNYLLDSNYTNGFKNNYRNNISFIINDNFTKLDTDDLYIQGGSNIEIHFKDNITDMNNFFSVEEDINSKYINSIDLSRFDSSHVVNMSSMFSGCSSLTHINFSNIITSSVKDIFIIVATSAH